MRIQRDVSYIDNLLVVAVSMGADERGSDGYKSKFI